MQEIADLPEWQLKPVKEDKKDQPEVPTAPKIDKALMACLDNDF